MIDQLDAISKASGRFPAAMDVIASLVREARAFPEMRLVFACRRFDLDNDDRVRRIAHDQRTLCVPKTSSMQVKRHSDTHG
ncbi:hypothetical protein [Lentzea kentuckyensis]|uniref:hypothetical protein n=1 Tax=Lentzea kentuckyensis TaxID=360086 RepID=UPI00117A67B3|nr:hypothetical protein [Lentzea kentuckyensis]